MENTYQCTTLPNGLRVASEKLGGQLLADESLYWNGLRDHTAKFFQDNTPLWRISLPAAHQPLDINGEWLVEWGGAQRWLKTNAASKIIRAQAAKAGGHATLFRGGDRQGEIFHPLSPALAALHQRLKAAFDPHGLLNPGRMFAD